MNTRELAYNEANQQLSRNNSAMSTSFTQALSLLEGAEGSAELRRKIIAYLQTRAREDGLRLDEGAFRALPTLKSKLAYVVALAFPDAPPVSYSPAARGNDLSQLKARVWGTLEHRLREIHEDILVKSDLTPSFVLRHAALNRVDLVLTTPERHKLTLLAQKLAGLSGISDDIRASFHFADETDAQKLYKLKEGVSMLARSGIKLDDADVTEVESLTKKLEKLEALNDKHHEFNASWNDFMRRNEGVALACVLSRGDERKMRQILTECGIADMKKYIHDLVAKGGEEVDLTAELQNITDNPKFEAAIAAVGWHKTQFQDRFSKHVSYILARWAKKSLDRAKIAAFWDKTRDFNLDVKNWREMMRDRVLALHPVNDLALLDSYFDKDLKIFHADRSEVHPVTRASIYNMMLTRVRAVIATRYTSLDVLDQERLAHTLLQENQNKMELFYGDKDPFDAAKEDTGRQRFWDRVSTAGRGIKYFADKSTPVISALVNGIEFGVRNLAKGATYVVEWGSWTLREGATKYNNWVNNKERKGFFRKAAMLPFKASLLLTKPLQWTGQFGKWGSKGLREQSGKLYDAANAKVNTNVHAGTNADLKNETLRMGSWSDVSGLAGLVTQAYHKGVGTLWGKGLDKLGDWRYDASKREQERCIIDNLYRTHGSQELRNALEQIDLMSSLQDRSEYLFDEDGVSDTASVAAEKKTEKQEDKLQNDAYGALAARVTKITEKLEAKVATMSDGRAKEVRAEFASLLKDLAAEAKLPLNASGRGADIQSALQKIIDWIGTRATATAPSAGMCLQIETELAAKRQKITDMNTDRAAAMTQCATLSGKEKVAQLEYITKLEWKIEASEKEQKDLEIAQSFITSLERHALPVIADIRASHRAIQAAIPLFSTNPTALQTACATLRTHAGSLAAA